MPEKTTVTLEEHTIALKTIASQKSEIKQLTDQLQEATDAFTLLKTKFDVATAAEKDTLIKELVTDSKGKLTVEILKDDSLEDLYLRKETIAIAEPKNFLSVMRAKDEDAQKQKPQGTVGFYNPETKKWEGGV